MPWKVRSPVTLYFLSVCFSKPVLLNTIVGYFAASKKSAPFKCVSLSSTSVSIELTSATMLTTASEKSSFCAVISDSVILNDPSISDIIKLLTEKRSDECSGSRDQVEGSRLTNENKVMAAAGKKKSNFFMIDNFIKFV